MIKEFGLRKEFGHGKMPRAFSAFTLLELLVVIGIMSILMAILIPAVNSAMEKAKQAACGNNLKQVGIEMQCYCSDYGYIPPITISGYSQSPHFVLKNTSGLAVGLGMLINEANIRCFGCPSRKDMGSPDIIRRDWNLGGRVLGAYIYRETFNNFDCRYDKNEKVPAVAMDFDSLVSSLGRAHYGRWVNMLAYDGHVKGRSNLKQEFTYQDDDAPEDEKKIWDNADTLF